MASTALLSKCF